MIDYKLKFTNEAEAKSVLSQFVVDGAFVADNEHGSLIIQSVITPTDNTDPENPVQLAPLEGFFVFLRSRKFKTDLAQYVTSEPLFNVSFGPLPPPPNEVGALSLRRALRIMGLKAGIEAAIATQSEEVKEAYEYATIFKLTDPMLTQLVPALGISQEVINDVFRLAKELE